MFSNILITVASSILSVGLLTGCASTKSATAPAKTEVAFNHAIMCPKCETVWVAKVTDQGLKTQRLVSQKQMTCPDCDAAAATYVEGGKTVLHDCPSCKVALQPLTPQVVPAYPKGSRPY